MCAKIERQRVRIGPYEVDLLIDEDGHLNLWVESKDGSEVQEADVNEIEDGIFAVRLTTEKIETDYKNAQKGE